MENLRKPALIVVSLLIGFLLTQILGATEHRSLTTRERWTAVVCVASLVIYLIIS